MQNIGIRHIMQVTWGVPGFVVISGGSDLKIHAKIGHTV